jgi:hypothetical protein
VFVVHVQVLSAAAVLAAPAIALENLLVQFLVGFPVHANPAAFCTSAVHDAFWPTSVRNSCF